MLALLTVGCLMLGVASEAQYVQSKATASKAYGAGTATAVGAVRKFELLMNVGFGGAIVCGTAVFALVIWTAARRTRSSAELNSRGFDVIK